MYKYLFVLFASSSLKLYTFKLLYTADILMLIFLVGR